MRSGRNEINLCPLCQVSKLCSWWSKCRCEQLLMKYPGNWCCVIPQVFFCCCAQHGVCLGFFLMHDSACMTCSSLHFPAHPAHLCPDDVISHFWHLCFHNPRLHFIERLRSSRSSQIGCGFCSMSRLRLGCMGDLYCTICSP